MEFYSVKHRKKIDVPNDQIKKKTYNTGKSENSIRYAAVAKTTVDGDEVNLTKFINKATFDSLQVEEVK
jgi:hypothetical protein